MHAGTRRSSAVWHHSRDDASLLPASSTAAPNQCILYSDPLIESAAPTL